MIKINLLGDDTGIDHTGIFFVAGYAANIAIVVLIAFFLYTSISSQIEKAELEKEELSERLARLQETTKEVKALEKKKKELNDKLVVIARLKRSKAGPVHVLDDLNTSIPERAWLRAIKEKSDALRIDGYALDNQTIAVFMKELEKSDYYEKVELIQTKQALKKNVKLKEFTLEAKINYAGKIIVPEEGLEEGKDAKDDNKKAGLLMLEKKTS